jgi:hypothetical protein
MNNTFIYAIDERNLRIQLRSIESTSNNEAWSKFEQVADANPFRTAKRPFQGINITLNRNFVLPAVFGIVICLFSLLLLNFVSIKNPAVKDSQKAELTTVIPEPIVMNIEKSMGATPAQQVKTEEFNVVGTKPAPAQIVKEQTPAQAPVTGVAQDPSTAVTGDISSVQQPVTEVKKRRKKQVTIEEQIRPTTFSDESEGVSEPEPEEVPN